MEGQADRDGHHVEPECPEGLEAGGSHHAGDQAEHPERSYADDPGGQAHHGLEPGVEQAGELDPGSLGQAGNADPEEDAEEDHRQHVGIRRCRQHVLRHDVEQQLDRRGRCRDLRHHGALGARDPGPVAGSGPTSRGLLPDFCGLPAVFAVVVGAELLAIALAIGTRQVFVSLAAGIWFGIYKIASVIGLITLF